MTRLIWNAPEERFFDAGLDRGVLYPKKPEPMGAILATNLITNPSFEYGTDAGWNFYIVSQTGSISRTIVENPATYTGTKVYRITNDSMGLRVSDKAGIRSDVSISIPAGSPLTAVVNIGGTLPVNREFKISAWYYQENNTLLGEVVAIGVFNSTGLKKALINNPYANATKVRLYIYMQGTQPVGATQNVVATDWWVDGIGLYVGQLDTPALDLYFDGDFPDTGEHTYMWSGTPGQSTSLRRERVGVAVPWNGLVSVEEEGGEAAASYYVDGRPFLHLPRPKEYKASLSAYTYPDAFAEIMGVAEVADGMYLDSQMGLAFNLCYRTKVGNGLDGIEHGYKMHLVYNATVVPGGLSYETMGDAINPVTFSWDIQAVPVQVEGFRPTAHIIIDTRHMDANTIDAIERLLYGDETNVAHMPSPQTIFDLLSYGDTIIVTDNGDGTFDVTGAYENVYMLADGVFRVDNVDGQDNGDGTFTISSTNV